MKTRFILSALAGLAMFTIFFACQKNTLTPTGVRMPVLPSQVYTYNELPEGIFFNPFGNITVDNHKATLGRVLFYDTQLSVNNRVSCGTCHHQQHGFADQAAFSEGFENNLTLRNTPSIVNPGLQTSYFWDMRESNLHQMVTQPIANHIEMGLEEPGYMAAKVEGLSYYKELFQNAFGDEGVTSEKIGDALSNFVGSIVSVASKFDEGVENNYQNFTELELAGKNLFQMELPCAGCHVGESAFGWGSFSQNIGLEEDYVDNGTPGTDWNTGQAMDGWFKVPSLRNVGLTAPYMHDGRFSKLEDVIDFYSTGIVPHSQLSFSLREGWNGNFIIEGEEDPSATGENGVVALRMNLSNYEKQALMAFLNTMSDESLATDPKFSDPFVTQD